MDPALIGLIFSSSLVTLIARETIDGLKDRARARKAEPTRQELLKRSRWVWMDHAQIVRGQLSRYTNEIPPLPDDPWDPGAG